MQCDVLTYIMAIALRPQILCRHFILCIENARFGPPFRWRHCLPVMLTGFAVVPVVSATLVDSGCDVVNSGAVTVVELISTRTPFLMLRNSLSPQVNFCDVTVGLNFLNACSNLARRLIDSLVTQ